MQNILTHYNVSRASFCINNRFRPKDALLRGACVLHLPSEGGKKKKKNKRRKKFLTVLVSPHCSRRAAGAVSRCSEAQHRRVILSELLQTCHIAHMNTVLEVRSHGYHSNFFIFPWFPGQQLQYRKKKIQNKIKQNHKTVKHIKT